MSDPMPEEKKRPPPIQPGGIDGSEFLKHLRGFDDVGNDETIGAANTSKANNLSSLSQLFVAPDQVPPSPPVTFTKTAMTNSNNADAYVKKAPATSFPHLGGIAANDVTIGSGNTSKHRKFNSISELLLSEGGEQSKIPHDAPPPPPPPPPPNTSTAAMATNNHNGSTTKPRIGPNSSPFPPRPPPIHKHARGVSWGKNTDFVPPQNSDTEQPSLDESFSTGSGQAASGLRARGISVDEVLKASPFENEVETAIMKAIDERHHHRNRPRADTGTSTIFSQVPDTSHDFEISSMPSSEGGEPTSPRSNGSNKSSLKTDKSSSLKTDKSRPLIKRAQHRRGMSVEQTLSGLTAAMTALHGTEFVSEENERPEPLPSTAEDFAENALLLSNQQHQEPTSPGHRRLWTAVKEALPVLREQESNIELEETDDNVSPQEDIEAQPSNVSELPPDSPGEQSGRKKKKKHRGTVFAQTNDKLKKDWEVWSEFFRPRRGYILTYIKTVLFFFLLPLTGISAILFYFAENPPTGKANESENDDKASVSWILLFCCRQIITFSAALAMQGIVVDFLALGTRIMLRLVGPVITLLIVQAKGWPTIFFWWSIFNFAMLSGDRPFSHHWGFWGNVELFNEQNPSGQIVFSSWYMTVLTILVSVSLVVAVKRFLIGLYLGRQTFSHYGQSLAIVMNKMLLVSEVANLAKDIERSTPVVSSATVSLPSESFGWDRGDIDALAFAEGEDDGTINSLGYSLPPSEKIIDPNKRDPLTGNLPTSERIKLMQLLERWEEPERQNAREKNESASISAVLRFRKALTFIQKRYPFSYSFGPADTRETCIESCQEVYARLLKRTPTNDILPFETIALLALDEDDVINQETARQLVKIFRPDRQGNLTMLDFVKSVDTVYKEFRLLEASIENSSQIDRAFENMFNIVFYIVVVTIILSQVGLDPLALFLSLSSVILAFAFIIGSASSKYFEGVLFILVRRPYGIGDRINVGNVDDDSPLDGARPWVVENVTLFDTEVIHLPTNERASLSNGSLASKRIVNHARSPQAQFHIFLNFPIETPYEKIVIFKSALEEFMKARPREWLSLNGFRANRIVANEGFIEYIIVIQHREAWQQTGQILDSKSDLSSYCQEVAKQLNMHYKAPPLPVDLTYAKAAFSDTPANAENLDADALTREFRSSARNKHHIRVS